MTLFCSQLMLVFTPSEGSALTEGMLFTSSYRLQRLHTVNRYLVQRAEGTAVTIRAQEGKK